MDGLHIELKIVFKYKLNIKLFKINITHHFQPMNKHLIILKQKIRSLESLLGIDIEIWVIIMKLSYQKVLL